MKKTTLALTGSLLIAAAVAGGVALANSGDWGDRAERRQEMINMIFERADTNKDGAIDRAEMEAAKKARFAAMDADGDGSISLDEMKASAAARSADRAERRFQRMDANGDGALDEAELVSARGRRHNLDEMFNRLDADDDGKVTREEAEKVRFRHGRGRGDSGDD